MTDSLDRLNNFITTMRRLFAVLLTVCLGILIPVVALPVRVCLLDDSVLLPGFSTYGESPSHKDKCCLDCGNTDSGESCCFELKKLPDAEFPTGRLVLPILVCCEYDIGISVPPYSVIAREMPFLPSAPIRSPNSPGERRALLEIWNI